MAIKRAALGKGLGALIGNENDLVESGNIAATINHRTENTFVNITEIPVDKITANPYQPRSNFDETALEELTDSIRQYGIIQPITVRRVGLRYQIISGERRFKAATAAGLTKVPAYIKDTDDHGMLAMAIIENIQRQDLDAIEIALSFQRLIDECQLTQEAMADKVGKKRATVTNYLRLLKLPAEVQVGIRDKQISMGHAKAILALEDQAEQVDLCEYIIKKDLSVRQTEQRVQSMKQAKEEAAKAAANTEETPVPDSYYRVIDIVGKYFNNNVSLKRNQQGKGSITIHFSNDAEVESFLNAIETLKQ